MITSTSDMHSEAYFGRVPQRAMRRHRDFAQAMFMAELYSWDYCEYPRRLSLWSRIKAMFRN